LKRLLKDSIVMIISDHGFVGMDHTAYAFYSVNRKDLPLPKNFFDLHKLIVDLLKHG